MGRWHTTWQQCEKYSLHWRHSDHDGVSNHQPHDCLLNRLFRRRSKKTSKLRVTGLGAGNSPGTGEFPAQMASNAENVSIWWRHHIMVRLVSCTRGSHGTGCGGCSNKSRFFISLYWILLYKDNLWWPNDMETLPHYFSNVRTIHTSPADSLTKGRWCRAFAFVFVVGPNNLNEPYWQTFYRMSTHI